jgi:hypothetical protein
LHEAKDIAGAHPQVSHPTEVLDLGITYFPVLDEIDPHLHVRGIERHIIDKPKAMHETRSAVVSLIIGHTAGVRRCLHLLEQKGMIAFFDPKDRVQSVGVQGLDVRSIGTQAIFGDDELEVGVSWRNLTINRLAALRSQSFLAVPSCFPIGSGMSGITARTSGWINAAPNI